MASLAIFWCCLINLSPVIAQFTEDIGHCRDGAVRLEDGYSDVEGRVEVCHDYQWGTICDDDWSLDDASVVCRQLGYDDADMALGRAFFGEGHYNQPIFLEHVVCSGAETRLSDCYNTGWGHHACSHEEDVGVVCAYHHIVSDGDVRLSDGLDEMEGRVEIYYGNQWGTVCDDLWGTNEALVVCRQLGYSGVSSFYLPYFLPGQGLILLDDVDCDGDEESLLYCSHNPWGINDCSHAEDVGIRCSYNALPSADDNGMNAWVIGVIVLTAFIVICFLLALISSACSTKRRSRPGSPTVFSVSGDPYATLTSSSAQSGERGENGVQPCQNQGYVPNGAAPPPSYDMAMSTERPQAYIPYPYTQPQNATANGNTAAALVRDHTVNGVSKQITTDGSTNNNRAKQERGAPPPYSN